jgi:hypothetical protein
MSSDMAQHQAGEGISDSQDRLFQGFLGYGGFSALDVDAAGLIRRALNRPAQPAKPPSGARSQPGRSRPGEDSPLCPNSCPKLEQGR